MNTQGNNFKNSLLYIINKMTLKEKIIWVIQMILTVVILVLAILGMNNVISIQAVIPIDSILLTLLFIACGIRTIPERVIYAILYFICALAMCGIFIASFLI